MNELDSILRKQKRMAAIFDTIITVSILAFGLYTLWTNSLEFRIFVKHAILLSGLYRIF